MRTFPLAALAADERLLQRAVLWSARPWPWALMRLASRLGDGPAWWGTGAIALLFGGREGAALALQGVVAGGLNALVYKACKRRFVRPRPFRILPDLPFLWAPPGDFSFPSGHTLHAFTAATLIAAHFPPCALPAFLLAALIGASRVFLAVHYPSDVAAGAIGGVAVGLAIAAAFA